MDRDRYQRTADLRKSCPRLRHNLAGDHIYNMDYGSMSITGGLLRYEVDIRKQQANSES